MVEPILAADDLVFSYPGARWRIRLRDFRLEAGERVACVGRSGSGKTTLVNLLCGLLPPDSGSLRFQGKETGALHDGARRALRLERIGLVFQEFELIEYLTARDNILLPLRLQGLRIGEADLGRLSGLSARAGIDHVLGRRPAGLSHGERQRTALCRALMGSPPLLFADEPTGNLDPATSESVVDLLFDEVRAAGSALFMVTHHHEILNRFDRVLRMEDAIEVPSP